MCTLTAEVGSMCTLLVSVVILALNLRKSGQIANKGFMIYYGTYR